MNSPDRDAAFRSRANRKASKALRGKRSSRRLFLEPLEPRQMMTIVPIEGTPFWDFEGNFRAPQSFLTDGQAYLSAPTQGDAQTIAINYLRTHAADFGLTVNDLNHFTVTNKYTDEHNGLTHIYLQQTFNGLPIADAHANVSVDNDGSVLTAGVSFVAGLQQPSSPQPLSPTITPFDALNATAAGANVSTSQPLAVSSESAGHSQLTVIEWPDLSHDPIPVELQYVPAPGGGVELTWRVIARLPGWTNWVDVGVSAEGDRAGTVIRVADWTANASYNVFAVPLEDPADGNRSIVTDPQDPLASPFGWHDTNGMAGAENTDTQGNNVIAQDDTNGDDMGGTRPNGGAGLNFTAPLTLPAAPATHLDASIINLFYASNIIHDVLFHYGFDEAAGNFRQTNYSGQGIGNDRLVADAQDSLAVNNAFMQTPPDGMSGRMTVGTSLTFTPDRDLSLDNVTIFHEFGHGVSNRLTGGPANANALNSLQSGGMGEGWSDWLGLLLTFKPTDNKNTPMVIGPWSDGPAGIRRFPYSFDFNIDPLTLNNYNGDQFPQQNNTEVHNSGELWCSVLLDLTWLLIEKHGFDPNLYTGNGGNNLALQLVLDGMKLQPANPTFLQARDAILAADVALTGGANFAELWTAFARRGFGVSADAGTDADSLVVRAAFDRPAAVTGTVFHDVDRDGVRDAGEPPLSGWTVYNDENNNGRRDTGETSTVTSATGVYELIFVGGTTARIREVVMPGWALDTPESGVHVIQVTQGANLSGFNFGNVEIPGQVHGIKFNDLDGDGTQDTGEPGLEGVVIYVDLNKDGKIGILEPAAITDRFGKYTILGVPPATNHTVREVFQPGMIQTFPDPAGMNAGAHVNVVVIRDQITPNINFGNRTALDFGDAPSAVLSGFAASYPVTLAQNGARHGILPGFGLGSGGTGTALVDAEADGQPSANASGDGADENGVVVSGLTPGMPASATVTVSTGGFSAGVLQGFIDWNRDGDWSDAGEKVISDFPLSAGTTNVPFTVPSGVTLGATFARFRYGYERGLGATGPAMAGEVEDYQVTVLANVPVANDDGFGAAFGTTLVKQGTSGNVLDVLANDFGVTVNGTVVPPDIKTSTFPTTTTRDGTLSIQFDMTLGRNVVLYTPAASTIGIDTFQYQVTAGGLDSNFATVQIDVTASDPKAVDDSFTLNAALTTAPQQLTVLANDVPKTGLTVTAAQTLTTGLPANTFVANGGTVTFNPPAGFRGTIIGTYTTDDADPLTNPSTARITVQLLNFANGMPDPTSATTTPYLAQLTVEVLDVMTGDPITMIADDSEFLVRVSAFDLRSGGAVNERGVEAAYLDLLFNSDFATTIATPGGFFPFNIAFNGQRQQVDVNTVQASTVSSVTGDAGLSSVNGFYNNKILSFFGGNVNGQTVRVLNYNGATRTFTFATPLMVAPSVGTQFEVLDPPVGPTSSVTAATSATSFSGGASLSSTDDAFSTNNDFNLVFTSGPLAGQSGNIIDYIGATRTFVFAQGTFSATPPVGSQFRIESALYNRARSGFADRPAPGAIDEVGGAHISLSGTDPVGKRPAEVFTVRMRATNPTPAGQPLRFIGDPADSPTPVPDATKILLFNPAGGSPVELIDEQVFIKSPQGLTILGPGEGEFTNLRNPLDVSDDGYVSAIDALLVVNDMNAFGGRSLSQLGLAQGGALPPQNYLDVNFDSHVTPLDALLIVNFLNSLSSSGASGEGESGEGESAGLGAGGAEGEAAAPIDGSLLAALTPAISAAGGADESGGDAPVDLPITTTTAPVRRPHAPLVRRTASEDRPLQSRLAELETDATDEVFSSLGQFRHTRRSRR